MATPTARTAATSVARLAAAASSPDERHPNTRHRRRWPAGPAERGSHAGAPCHAGRLPMPAGLPAPRDPPGRGDTQRQDAAEHDRCAAGEDEAVDREAQIGLERTRASDRSEGRDEEGDDKGQPGRRQRDRGSPKSPELHELRAAHPERAQGRVLSRLQRGLAEERLPDEQERGDPGDGGQEQQRLAEQRERALGRGTSSRSSDSRRSSSACPAIDSTLARNAGTSAWPCLRRTASSSVTGAKRLTPVGPIEGGRQVDAAAVLDPGVNGHLLADDPHSGQRDPTSPSAGRWGSARALVNARPIERGWIRRSTRVSPTCRPRARSASVSAIASSARAVSGCRPRRSMRAVDRAHALAVGADPVRDCPFPPVIDRAAGAAPADRRRGSAERCVSATCGSRRSGRSRVLSPPG